MTHGSNGMATQRELRALLATDGSRDARRPSPIPCSFRGRTGREFGRSVREELGRSPDGRFC